MSDNKKLTDAEEILSEFQQTQEPEPQQEPEPEPVVSEPEPQPEPEVATEGTEQAEENPFVDSPIAVEGEEDTAPRNLPKRK